MAINKVVYGNNTLIDLTEDSVLANNLLEGETAHDKSGNPVTGTAKQGHIVQNSSGTDMTQRAKMQFPDSFVSDDETNGRTIVENIKEHTTASDYENATEDGIHVIDDGNDALIGAVSDDYVEVKGNGTKTYSQVLDELFGKIDFTKIRENTCLFVGGSTEDQIFNDYIVKKNSSNIVFSSENLSADGNHIYLYKITIQSSGSQFIYTDNGTVTSASSMKFPNGLKIRLYYGNRKAVVDLQTTANRCLMKNGESVESTIAGNELNCSVFFSTTAVANNYFAFLGYFSATPTLVSANVLGVGDAPISDFAIGGIDAHNFYVYTSNANYVGKAIYMKLRY